MSYIIVCHQDEKYINIYETLMGVTLNLAEKFGHQLRVARKELGLSQRELGKRIGVTQAHVSKVEGGTDMRLTTLLNFARYLGYEVIMVPRQGVHEAMIAATAAAGAFETARSPGLEGKTLGELIIHPSPKFGPTRDARSLYGEGGLLDDKNDDDEVR